jgi:hypothetical protein
MFSVNARVSRLSFILITGWLIAFGSSAEATTFVKFYTDAGNTHGYGNQGDDFSGAGTLYANMTTPGSGATATLVTCPTVGSCSSDNIQTTETFNLAGGLVLTVSANSGMKVWDDLTPNFGGIGVGTGSTGADTVDQINGTNVLTLTFSQAITLTGVATLFDGPHGPFGSGDPLSNTTGFFLLNGNAVSFANANNNLLNLSGTVFTFAEDTLSDPQFYVSGLAYTSATPLPAALPLFASGLGAFGLLARRRKRKSAALPA